MIWQREKVVKVQLKVWNLVWIFNKLNLILELWTIYSGYQLRLESVIISEA